MRKFIRKLTDTQRRAKQAAKIARVIMVHQLNHGRTGASIEEVRSIATQMGVSERTIWRDLATLQVVYRALESNKLDK